MSSGGRLIRIWVEAHSEVHVGYRVENLSSAIVENIIFVVREESVFLFHVKSDSDQEVHLLEFNLRL